MEGTLLVLPPVASRSGGRRLMNLNTLRNLTEAEMGPPDPRVPLARPGQFLPPGQEGPLLVRPKWHIVDYDGPGQGLPPGFRPTPGGGVEFANPNPTHDINGDGVIDWRDKLYHPTPSDVPAIPPTFIIPPDLADDWEQWYPGDNHGVPLEGRPPIFGPDQLKPL